MEIFKQPYEKTIMCVRKQVQKVTKKNLKKIQFSHIFDICLQRDTVKY